jgi:uncharacterized protein YndB with AHSA1/START domain
MKKSAKTIEFTVERAIPAPPAEVYDSWLDPKTPGTPWNTHKKLILNPKVDECFYWNFDGIPHFGRFTKLKRGSRIEHTWMSRYTDGEESHVVITFTKQGENTVMTLTHSDLPDNERGRAHNEGWNLFMGEFAEKLGKKSLKRKKK